MDRWIVDDTPSRRYPVYTRGNVGEVFPLPVTPLTWTLSGRPCAEEGWRDAFVRYGAFDRDEFAPDQLEILGVFGGYCYINVSISRILGVRTPGLTPEQVDYSFWGEMAGVPPYAAQPTDESPAHAERIQQTVGWILSTTELPELLADQREMAELRAGRPDFSTYSDADLVAWIRGHLGVLRRLFAQHLFISYCALVPMGMIAGICQALGDPTMAMRLVAGLGDVDSAAPSVAMWELGRLAAASPEIGAAFHAGFDGLLERLRDEAVRGSPEVRAFLERFDRFLYDFGSRGPNEWETSSPSWEIRPELALAAIDRMRVSPEAANPAGHTARLVEDREQLGAQLTGQLAGDPETQGQFVAAFNAAKLFLPGRERTKTNVIRLVNEFRVAAEELGRRMVAGGYLADPHHLSMLCEDELDAFLADPANFVEVIRQRAKDYASLFEVEPPFIIDGVVPSPSEWPHRDRSTTRLESGARLAGIPGCPGQAKGRARVILDPGDPTAREPGDVLVAPITDPAWTPLFVPASAVVVDVGAQMSHAVIVARELGIPCVVSVTDATRKIPDGAMVSVDGTSGVVELL